MSFLDKLLKSIREKEEMPERKYKKCKVVEIEEIPVTFSHSACLSRTPRPSSMGGVKNT